MITLNDINKKQIIFVGDIHGEFATMRFKLETAGVQDAYIIQVGDFGMGFHKPGFYAQALERLNDFLLESNNHLYAIRGNHDDPDYFRTTNNPFNLSNITLLADYTELILLDKKMLFVGGAFSVDRCYRVLNKSYWTDEPFVLREDFPFGKYDCVVTHARPAQSGLFSTTHKIRDWLDKDLELERDLQAESELLSKLYELTKPPAWIFGHYHQGCVNITPDTKFRCLDILELYPFIK